MPVVPPTPSQVAVSEDVLLDGRLALFHKTQRWLAVADLHFGYEISQRLAGRLMPLWGMRPVEERLVELLGDYAPERLVIVGDLVHDKAAATAARALIDRLRSACEVIASSGGTSNCAIRGRRMASTFITATAQRKRPGGSRSSGIIIRLRRCATALACA